MAVGEQFGDRWDINELVENRLIDYTRVTLPNTGGFLEFKKICSMAETHYVGMIPHFTGSLINGCACACTGFQFPITVSDGIGRWCTGKASLL